MTKYFKFGLLESALNFEREFPWLLEAKKRVVNLQAGELRSTGTIMDRYIVAPDIYALQRINPMVTYFYPEKVMSPIGGYHAVWQPVRLSMCFPDYHPRVLIPENLGEMPDRNDLMFMVNSTVTPIKVKWTGEENEEQFQQKFQAAKIAIDSPIPGSFLYDLRGNLSGIAVTSVNDGEAWAFPSETLMDLYWLGRTRLPEVD